MTRKGQDKYGVFRPVSGPRALPAGPYAVEARREFGMSHEVHHREVVAERNAREQAKRYAAMKDELARKRGQS